MVFLKNLRVEVVVLNKFGDKFVIILAIQSEKSKQTSRESIDNFFYSQQCRLGKSQQYLSEIKYTPNVMY